MILKLALKDNGYTPEDLYHRLRNKGHPVTRTNVHKSLYASYPKNTILWNAILECLDDMGIDWKMGGGRPGDECQGV